VILRVVLLSLVTLAVDTTFVAAQVPLRFLQWSEVEYDERIRTLCESHVNNHKVRAVHKSWEATKSRYRESVYDSMEQTELLGKVAWIAVASGLAKTGPSVEYVQHVTPDAQHFLSSTTRKPPYKLESFCTEWKEPNKYANSFAYFLATKQIYHVKDQEKLQSHSDVQHEGQAAIQLLTKDKAGVVTTVIVAKDTFQLLYSETDRSPNYDDRGALIQEKTITRLTYRESGGKRVPTRYEQYRLQLDGVRRKLSEDEYTEYTPYTPTADELDLEKRFGVKPVEHEPRPESAKPKRAAKSSSKLWYIVGGVLAVVAVGFVVVARRRRGASEE
jgi:hypothetical protein